MSDLPYLTYVGLAVCLVASVGCEHRTGGGPPATDSVRSPGPSQSTWDAHFTMKKDGRRRAIIAAERMDQYETDDSTYSVWRTLDDTSRVRSYVFDEQGDSSATILADSVVFYNHKGQFEAYGNVILTTDEGRRLESEHLLWSQGDRAIRTDRFVYITTPTETVRGNGLAAEEDLATYQIGEFTAEVDVDEES